jgi:hypothetical protein
MAARRLIIVLLVLFGISVAAAAIAPDRKGGLIGASDETSTSTADSSTTSTSPAPARSSTGEALTARIDASTTRPETAKGFAGDQLELNVRSSKPRTIEIGGYGVTDFAGPETPAAFNLLLRDPGRFPITDADSGRIVGRLVIHKPAKQGAGRDGGQSRDRSRQTT